MNLRKGFTLIELLVVIAIIGLLSSVVLASLNTARIKGSDTTIKSQLASLRSAAELHYDTNSSSYATFCTSAVATSALQAIRNAGGPSITATNVVMGTAGAAATLTCHSGTVGWAIEAPLRGSAGFWCVDYLGKTQFNAAPALGQNQYAC